MRDLQLKKENELTKLKKQLSKERADYEKQVKEELEKELEQEKRAWEEKKEAEKDVCFQEVDVDDDKWVLVDNTHSIIDVREQKASQSATSSGIGNAGKSGGGGKRKK